MSQKMSQKTSQKMSQKKKQVRAAFRDTSLKRDNHRCVMCGVSEEEAGELDVHHITDRNEMPNGGYVKENGISLCPPCHIKAETWHTSGHTEFVPGYKPADLYLKIGSSHEKAVRASERLG